MGIFPISFDTGWPYGPSLPEPRNLHCVAQIDDNKVLLAGGITKGKISKMTKSKGIHNPSTVLD